MERAVEAATPSAIPVSAHATTQSPCKTQPRQYRLPCLRARPASVGQVIQHPLERSLRFIRRGEALAEPSPQSSQEAGALCLDAVGIEHVAPAAEGEA
eukprot:3836549-Alexandrium_andersonii.AAC.1